MRKGIEESDKAKYYACKAENAANGTAIMSDDPAADTKLLAKIADAEKLQEAMKACNAAIRKHAKAGPEAQVDALVALGRTEAQDADSRPGFITGTVFDISQTAEIETNRADVLDIARPEVSANLVSQIPELQAA